LPFKLRCLSGKLHFLSKEFEIMPGLDFLECINHMANFTGMCGFKK